MRSQPSAIGWCTAGPFSVIRSIVDDAVLQQIQALSVLAPLHNPANARGIEQARVAFPAIPQVAVFDTAFFRDLPAAAATYAIDRTVAADNQIRRYGFHGTSHQYVSQVVPTVLGRDPAASSRSCYISGTAHRPPRYAAGWRWRRPWG